MSLFLGCIADDYTGATDLANMLVRAGLRTTLWLGASLPAEKGDIDSDAIVVALRSRSLPAPEAVAQSLTALQSLQRLGARRYFFKYCSTFDSTESGNIGPVAEAIMRTLGVEQAVFCPAFPENGRTVYLGHLFVGKHLLNESGMERHPLNPMQDPSLLRVLQRQSKQQVGLVALNAISKGPGEIENRFAELRREGASLLVCDAIVDAHLRHLGKAIVDWPLVTGSSALAFWLGEAYRGAGLVQGDRFVPRFPTAGGHCAILSGSCSPATCRQVEAFKQRGPALALELRSVINKSAAAAALDWASDRISEGPVLIYSTMPPDQMKAAQQQFGETHAALAVEQTMSEIARGLVELDVRRLVIAGGETAGAVMDSLGVRGLSIGPQIEPGVPWTESLSEPPLALALKSGNFGSDDFFSIALESLP